MSVLSCARRGCDNIMCDRLSHTYGYICDDCFEELVASGPDTNVEEFMNNNEKRPNLEDEARARYEVTFPKGG